MLQKEWTVTLCTRKSHVFISEIRVEQVTFGMHIKALNLSGTFSLCVKLSQYTPRMFYSTVYVILSFKARHVNSCLIFLS
jgi:hypothetical protein